VFDDVGGRWIALATSPNAKCMNDSVEAWEVIVLQPRPYGKLVGEHMITDGRRCNDKRP
jgi:hypothetical protein